MRSKKEYPFPGLPGLYPLGAQQFVPYEPLHKIVQRLIEKEAKARLQPLAWSQD